MSLHRAILFLFAASVSAQVTPTDVVFAGLSALTAQLAYQQCGGDMKSIGPLMAAASNPDKTLAYRGLTHAMAVMQGREWTPDVELATAFDFSIRAKAVGTGAYLATRASFLFHAPAAAQPPSLFHI